MDVDIADLWLDGENPRHESIQGQRDIVAALIRDDGSKLLALAKDIAEYGLNPMDTLAVTKRDEGGYTVLEGNRRLAALKLLDNPGFAPAGSFADSVRKVASTAKLRVRTAPCFEFADNHAARHWIELRHTGERGGAGVVAWSAVASQRFHSRPGSHTAKAVDFSQAISTAFPDSGGLQADLETVMRTRPTTLGRMLGDPDVRARLGVEVAGGNLTLREARDQVERKLARVIHDLATELTVSALKHKSQRLAYLDQIDGDLPKATGPDEPVGPVLPASTDKPKRPRTKLMPPPGKLFRTINLANFSQAVQGILRELRELDPDHFPNACAVLTRAVLELTTAELIAAKGWKSASLAKNVKTCLYRVDPSQKDDRFQAIRQGATSDLEYFSAATLHAWVHNAAYRPTAMDVRIHAGNYEQFLDAMDRLMA